MCARCQVDGFCCLKSDSHPFLDLFVPIAFQGEGWVTIMETPLAGHVKLLYVGALQRWYVRHDVTNEWQWLPRSHHPYALAEHAEGLLLENVEDSVWAASLFQNHVFQDEQENFFVQTPEGSLYKLQSWFGSFTLGSLELPVGDRRPSIKVARFKRMWHGGCKCWFAVADLPEAAGITSNLTSSKWLQSWWKSWEKAVHRLGFLGPHLRRQMPSAQSTSSSSGECDATFEYPSSCLGKVESKILDFCSCSSAALICLLVRLCTPAKASAHIQDKKANIEEWYCLLDSLVTMCAPSEFEIAIYEDPNVVTEVGLPVAGQGGQKLLCHGGQVHVPEACEQSATWSALVEDFADEPIYIVQLLQRWYLRKGSSWAFRQLVNCVATFVEDVVSPAESAPPQSATTSEDLVMERLGLQGPAIPRRAQFVQRMKDLAHTNLQQKCLKYMLACRKIFKGQMHYSIAVDASRLSHKKCLLGCIGMPNNIAAWLCPQVLHHSLRVLLVFWALSFSTAMIRLASLCNDISSGNRYRHDIHHTNTYLFFIWG